MSITMSKKDEPVVRKLIGDGDHFCVWWHTKRQPKWYRRMTWGGRFGLRRGSIHFGRLWVSW